MVLINHASYTRACVLMVLLMPLCLSCYGQETPLQDTTNVPADSIQTEVYREVKSGIYVDVQLENVPGTDGRINGQQFGIGLSYQKWQLGMYRWLALKETARTLIFPNNFDLIYGYFGGYVGLELINNQTINGTFRLTYGHGDMIWELTDTKEDFLRDTFHLLKPEILISYIPIAFFRPYIALGYRKLTGLDLAGVSNSDFSGITLSIGIKVGYFK